MYLRREGVVDEESDTEEETEETGEREEVAAASEIVNPMRALATESECSGQEHAVTSRISGK